VVAAHFWIGGILIPYAAIANALCANERRCACYGRRGEAGPDTQPAQQRSPANSAPCSDIGVAKGKALIDRPHFMFSELEMDPQISRRVEHAVIS
jgi:hypothetical protein